MLAAEIVVHEVECHAVSMVLDLLGERVGQRVNRRMDIRMVRLLRST